MTEPELDRKLADRLRSAAEHEPYRVLDEEARVRVVHALHRQPLEKPRSKWPLLLSATAAVAAAAALAFFVRTEPAEKIEPVCGLPKMPAFQAQDLDLGKFGRVVAEPGADVHIARAESCVLEISLNHGKLAAELHDLRPAQLSVRTPLGAVIVHGTTFSVEVDDALEVVLLEGKVELSEDARTSTTLSPGHALTRARASRPRVSAVRDEQAESLRAMLSPPRVEPPTPVPEVAPPTRARSATELLAAAERERREGDLAHARTLYREAGSAEGADAEVALLRWARLELENERAQPALSVLARYRQRYGRNFERAGLAAEASFLEVQVLAKLGRTSEAKQRANALVRRYPNSPQARAAAAWVF